jgi:hypothetical protein
MQGKINQTFWDNSKNTYKIVRLESLYTKINQKWVEVLNVIVNTIRPLKENMG